LFNQTSTRTTVTVICETQSDIIKTQKESKRVLVGNFNLHVPLHLFSLSLSLSLSLVTETVGFCRFFAGNNGFCRQQRRLLAQKRSHRWDRADRQESIFKVHKLICRNERHRVCCFVCVCVCVCVCGLCALHAPNVAVAPRITCVALVAKGNVNRAVRPNNSLHALKHWPQCEGRSPQCPRADGGRPRAAVRSVRGPKRAFVLFWMHSVSEYYLRRYTSTAQGATTHERLRDNSCNPTLR